MKITVFGLLKLVREGKAPKKIKYDTINYFFRNYDYKEIREGLIDEQSSWLERIDFYKLDDEVEIIEEDKKIEKIDVNHLQQIKKWKRAKILGNKINEIIDYLEEKE